MSKGEDSRRLLPLREGFFCDGHEYVISSTSLGGSGLTPSALVEQLQVDDPERISDLLRRGICLPLTFDGDCALDSAKVVLGDLTPEESEEWIGRIQSRLEVPCGEVLLLGGGGFEEDWETAIAEFEAPDPAFVNFVKWKVEPGTYLVELYAFSGSMTFNVAWGEHPWGIMRHAAETKQSLSQWWDTTRPGEPRPPWLECVLSEGDMGNLGLLDYLLRLRPWQPEDENLALPPLVPEINWCGVFEYRRSIPCPRGLPR